MGKRANSDIKKHAKKKDVFFNFNKLRRTLQPKEKEKIIRFFNSLRGPFKELQLNLIKINQRFDNIELKLKNFHQNFLKEINEENENNEFKLNDYDIQEIFGIQSTNNYPKNSNLKNIGNNNYFNYNSNNSNNNYNIYTNNNNYNSNNINYNFEDDNFFKKEQIDDKIQIKQEINPNEFSEKLFDYKSFKPTNNNLNKDQNIITNNQNNKINNHNNQASQWINKN